MTASKTFGGGAGIGGAGERRRFQSRLSLTYTTNGRPQNMRMGLSPQSLQRRTNDGSRRPERLSESLVADLHNGIKVGWAAGGRLPAPVHYGVHPQSLLQPKARGHNKALKTLKKACRVSRFLRDMFFSNVFLHKLTYFQSVNGCNQHSPQQRLRKNHLK
jgi:hypothetical protein